MYFQYLISLRKNKLHLLSLLEFGVCELSKVSRIKLPKGEFSRRMRPLSCEISWGAYKITHDLKSKLKLKRNYDSK